METQTMDKTVEFLNCVYKNTKMGMDSLSMLMDKVDDVDMRAELQKQLEEYTSFSSKVTDALSKKGALPEDSSMMQSVGLWTGVTVNTMIDKTPSHIAEMIIEGSNMGITQLTKELNRGQDVDSSARKIAEELQHMEERRVQRMKNWLN